MRLHTRFVLCVFSTVFTLIIISLLLPNSKVGTQLHKIALGASVDGLWKWVSDGDDGYKDGMNLVIFGDSWVDNTVRVGEEARGKSWTEVLCEEIKCTTTMNFAASQPSNPYPEHPPSGAMVSNSIYTAAVTSFSPSQILPLSVLPDLKAQIEEFLKMPPSASDSSETIFIVSFGIWDIYHFAGLDFTLGQNITDASISALFSHLDTLYAGYCAKAQQAPPPTGNSTADSTPKFRVVVPKLFDPTILPGWITQRPIPLLPSSVAEQQKNAMYLTNLWNSKLENAIGEWLQHDPIPDPATPDPATRDSATPDSASSSDANENEEIREPSASKPPISRGIFYYDLPTYLLNVLVEHQLEEKGLSDASGLGKGESPFMTVSLPCVRDGKEGEVDGYVNQNGQLMCKAPDENLWWDDFNLGAIANKAIGMEVAEMVRQGKTMKVTKQKEMQPLKADDTHAIRLEKTTGHFRGPLGD